MNLFRRFFTKPLRGILGFVMLAIAVLLALLTVLSAYGGMFDPDRFVEGSILAMLLPGVIWIDVIAILVCLFACKRGAVLILFSWLVCLPPILSFSPFNLPKKLTPAEEQRAFTVLTYNALQLTDFRGDVPGLTQNATLDYILSTDADIVALQEIKSWNLVPGNKVTDEQKSLLYERYPYNQIDNNAIIGLFSKYPFTVDTLRPPHDWEYHMQLYTINIRGQEVHYFNVHLQSIGLNDDDKELYQRVIKNRPTSERDLKNEYHEVKSQLLAKLGDAFKVRKEQAQYIRHVIDSIGGENWIVAGDFNDIPSCYAIRTIARDDFNDAYEDAAFGPTITYHANYFYFRIDHVLYRGDFKAEQIQRGKVESSDHYPLLTTFVFNKDVPLNTP